MSEPRLELQMIGTVSSPLTDPASAPKQGDEGAPDAWLVFDQEMLPGLDGVRAGDEVIVITGLDAMSSPFTHEGTRRGLGRGCSPPALRIAPTRLGCIAWRSRRSRGGGCGCGASRRSTGPRSST